MAKKKKKTITYSSPNAKDLVMNFRNSVIVDKKSKSKKRSGKHKEQLRKEISMYY